MNIHPHRAAFLVLLAVALGGCPKKDEGSSDDSAEKDKKDKKEKKKGKKKDGDKEKAGDSASPQPAPAPSASDPELRRFACTFEKVQGEGKDKQAVFTIENLGKEVATDEQTWEFYYDAAGKEQKNYPHAIIEELQPGQKVSRALGYSGEDFPKDIANYECEVTSAHLAGGALWMNDNLKAPAFEERPRGGFSLDYLRDHATMKVKATFEAKDGKNVAHLENLVDRPLTVLLIRDHMFNDKEEYITEEFENVSVEMDAKGKADVELSHGTGGDVKFLDPYVARVTFRDGKQENWENQNLAAMFNDNMKKRQH